MRTRRTAALAIMLGATIIACTADAPTAPTLATATAASASTQRGAAARPLTGACAITANTMVSLVPPILTQLSTADCHIAHLGRVAIANLQRVNIVTMVQEGEAIWTTANGDLVYASSLGTATVTGPGTMTFAGTARITGGTGRFEDATGELAVVGALDNSTGSGSFRYDGWIGYAASVTSGR